MSVSHYAYEPWKCDGEYCPGDCDLCYKADWVRDDEDLEEEIEQDGWKTWSTDCSWGKPEDLGETDADIQDTCDSE